MILGGRYELGRVLGHGGMAEVFLAKDTRLHRTVAVKVLRPGMKRLIADRGYDANRLRATLRDQGTIPVIPGRRNRKRPIQYDQRRYRDRWRVEARIRRRATLSFDAPRAVDRTTPEEFCALAAEGGWMLRLMLAVLVPPFRRRERRVFGG